MKKLFTIASLAALVLASCAKEEPKGEENGEGRVTINCQAETAVEITRAELTYEAKCDTPTKEDFALVITGEKLEAPKEYTAIADFEADSYLKYGTYTATVTAGDINEEGYNKATFVGVEEFEVEARKEKEVNITATIANALVKVEVTEAFTTYFPGGHTFELTTAAGNKFDVTAQTEPLFVAPTSLEISGTATKQPNQSGEEAVTVVIPTQKVESLKARTLYTVKFDVTNAGQATLEISLNDTLSESFDIEQELNDYSKDIL